MNPGSGRSLPTGGDPRRRTDATRKDTHWMVSVESPLANSRLRVARKKESMLVVVRLALIGIAPGPGAPGVDVALVTFGSLGVPRDLLLLRTSDALLALLDDAQGTVALLLARVQRLGGVRPPHPVTGPPVPGRQGPLRRLPQRCFLFTGPSQIPCRGGGSLLDDPVQTLTQSVSHGHDRRKVTSFGVRVPCASRKRRHRAVARAPT